MDVSSRDNIAIFVTRSVKTGQVGTHYTSHHITGDYSVLEKNINFVFHDLQNIIH